MKKLFLTTLFAAFSLIAFSQNYYLVPQEKKVLNYSHSVTSPMGDKTMYSKQYVTGQSANSITVATDVFLNETDEKSLQSVEMVYKLDSDNYIISISDVLKPVLAQLGEFEIVSSSGDITIPLTPKIGAKLPNANLVIKANVQGMSLEMDIEIRNRQMEAKEKVIVGAGEFECYKFTQESVVKVMGQEQVSKSIEYYAPGVGMVKNIVDSMGGTVVATMELKNIDNKK